MAALTAAYLTAPSYTSCPPSFLLQRMHVVQWPSENFTYQNIALSPDGTQYVANTGAADDAIGVWDVDSEERLLSLAGPSVFNGTGYSPDGTTFAATNDSRQVAIYDAESFEEIVTLEPETVDFEYMTGNLIVLRVRIEDLDNDPILIQLWDIEENNIVGAWEIDHSEVELFSQNIAPSPNGEQIIIANSTGTYWVIDMADDSVTQRSDDGGGYRQISFDSNGERLLTLGADGEVRVWSVEGVGEFEEIAAFTPDKAARIVKLHPTKEWVALAQEDAHLSLYAYDGEPRQIACRLSFGLFAGVNAISFDADGAHMAVSEVDNFVVYRLRGVE